MVGSQNYKHIACARLLGTCKNTLFTYPMVIYWTVRKRINFVGSFVQKQLTPWGPDLMAFMTHGSWGKLHPWHVSLVKPFVSRVLIGPNLLYVKDQGGGILLFAAYAAFENEIGPGHSIGAQCITRLEVYLITFIGRNFRFGSTVSLDVR